MQAIVPVVMPGSVFVAMGVAMAMLATARMLMRMATESGDGAIDHSGGTLPLVVTTGFGDGLPPLPS
jgi:hypothetical protein